MLKDRRPSESRSFRVSYFATLLNTWGHLASGARCTSPFAPFRCCIDNSRIAERRRRAVGMSTEEIRQGFANVGWELDDGSL